MALERRALPAIDYGVVVRDEVIAVVERKTLENLATSLSDGMLSFQLQCLAEVGRSALVVGGGREVIPPKGAFGISTTHAATTTSTL